MQYTISNSATSNTYLQNSETTSFLNDQEKPLVDSFVLIGNSMDCIFYC